MEDINRSYKLNLSLLDALFEQQRYKLSCRRRNFKHFVSDADADADADADVLGRVLRLSILLQITSAYLSCLFFLAVNVHTELFNWSTKDNGETGKSSIPDINQLINYLIKLLSPDHHYPRAEPCSNT